VLDYYYSQVCGVIECGVTVRRPHIVTRLVTWSVYRAAAAVATTVGLEDAALAFSRSIRGWTPQLAACLFAVLMCCGLCSPHHC